MNRYQDNISPGPSMQTICYTTPGINTMNLNSQYWYATPPSETEDAYKLDYTCNQESKMSPQKTSSRTKRRSRTTFTKLQVIILNYLKFQCLTKLIFLFC